LTIETLFLILPSIGIVWFYAQSPAGSAFGNDVWLSGLIMLGGVLTAVPLLLFALAARRMDYSTLGFIQYLAPTIVFLLGLTVFGQELKLVQFGSFTLIWSAIALFLWDLWRRKSAEHLSAKAPAGPAA
jgi:chloramphenicol-sensitive protein RarD